MCIARDLYLAGNGCFALRKKNNFFRFENFTKATEYEAKKAKTSQIQSLFFSPVANIEREVSFSEFTAN